MTEETKKAKGYIKQAAGKAVGDKELERDGKADIFKGKVEGAMDDVRHVKQDIADKMKRTTDRVKDVVKDVKQSIKGPDKGADKEKK